MISVLRRAQPGDQRDNGDERHEPAGGDQAVPRRFLSHNGEILEEKTHVSHTLVLYIGICLGFAIGSLVTWLL